MRLSSLLLLLFISASALAEQPAKPNILLLMAEDMSPRVGAFGDAVAVTPHLDALARQGMRYDRVFTTAGVCAPSRAAHILGMHQISTGTQHMRNASLDYFSVPPENVKAYPELLRASGYYTFTDSKLDYQFSAIGADTGPFSIWDAQGTTSWSGRGQNQPFFGFINFQSTHESKLFSPLGSMPHSIIHLAVQVMNWLRAPDIEVNVDIDPADVVLEPYYPDTLPVREDIAQHYENIALMDQQVGDILAALEQQGLAESTIVIWTTDHGDGLPRAKRELYDSGIKVPMIIRWPKAYRPPHVKPGEIDHQLISMIDLAPTILAMAGIGAPDYLQGQDFLTPGNTREYIYASRDRIDEVDDRERAIRDQQFKYIRSWYPELPQGHSLSFRDNLNSVRSMRELYQAGELNAEQRQWFEPTGEQRLYDLNQDPFELHNLASDPAYRADLQRLDTALNQRLAEIGDRSEESESAMIAGFQNEGEQAVTPAPSLSIENGKLHAKASHGASIGYQIDDGPWLLYSQPVTVSPSQSIKLKAVRYGWKESEEVTTPIE